LEKSRELHGEDRRVREESRERGIRQRKLGERWGGELRGGEQIERRIGELGGGEYRVGVVERRGGE
jgi:hypothetical protein